MQADFPARSGRSPPLTKTRPPDRRRLGRAAARQAIEEAQRALEQLLEVAEPAAAATEG